MSDSATALPLCSWLVRAAWLLFAVLAGCATAPPPAPSTPPVVSAPAPEAAPTPPPAPSAAPEATAEVPLEQRFADWVARFRDAAQAQGIDEATLRAAFDDVRYLPRVVELDRVQPEFARSVWDYLDITVS